MVLLKFRVKAQNDKLPAKIAKIELARETRLRKIKALNHVCFFMTGLFHTPPQHLTWRFGVHFGKLQKGSLNGMFN